MEWIIKALLIIIWAHKPVVYLNIDSCKQMTLGRALLFLQTVKYSYLKTAEHLVPCLAQVSHKNKHC